MALAFGGHSPVSAAGTKAQADSAYTARYNLYWNSSNNTFYKKDNRTGPIDFWRYVHDWETIKDRYELTRDSLYVRQMKNARTGFNRTNGTGLDWTKNDFNDDIEWWVISATCAYMLTKAFDYVKNSMSNSTTGLFNNGGNTGDGSTCAEHRIRIGECG